MKFPQPLARGRLVQRYKRFFADVVMVGLPIAFILWPRGAAQGAVMPATAES